MIVKCFVCTGKCDICTTCSFPVQADKYGEVYCTNGHHLGLISRGQTLQGWRDDEAVKYCKAKKGGKK